MTGERARSTDSLAEALRAFHSSSRGVFRLARAAYVTEILRWPYRHEFASVWGTADRIPGWFHEGSAVVLYALMRGSPPNTVVEIGSYLGRSTVFFALTLKQVSPHGRVVAIDPHTGDRQQLEALTADRLPTFGLFEQHCQATGVADVIDARVATSLEAAEGWSGPIDMLYVDGWHSYDAVIADGRAWLPHLSDRGVVVFDDYTAYQEVREAVHDLAAEGHYHLWGTIFGQAFGGATAEPPAAARRALLLSKGGLRWGIVRS